MSNTDIPCLPSEVNVKRSDPVYMAHSYLTKVPIGAIQPYVEAFTSPGDIVVDPFAGSGMTGVAAMTLDRRARLFDVSVLGRHIGSNYCNAVDAAALRRAARDVVGRVDAVLNNPYATKCSSCGEQAQTSKITTSVVVQCPRCDAPVNYYDSLEDAGWKKREMRCPQCESGINAKMKRVGEVPVVETVRCACSSRLIDQNPVASEWESPHELIVPSLEIGEDRQMYAASALGKHGLTNTASFFSSRNASVLATLRREIALVEDPEVSSKLLFAFTGILARASKRYQWSRARPLNASNANYYVAPVFYEWNVFELFGRKIEAIVKSDEFIRQERWARGANNSPDVVYENASATAIPLPDNSVDYVFTDPPFGWNIYYSDMNLFHEAWLHGDVTDPSTEAVIDRSRTAEGRTVERYEDMLMHSFKECFRILKDGGWMTLVFGSSTGEVWAVLQRAISRAGLCIEPSSIASLHKGQRSVKGLASGFENVATHDLIVSLRKRREDEGSPLMMPSDRDLNEVIDQEYPKSSSPSDLYVRVLRAGMALKWDLSVVDLRTIGTTLATLGAEVDPQTGNWLVAS